MPCGGIYPTSSKGKCWVCNKEDAKHFCEEWDTYIHARCAVDFLKTEEGKIVIDHGHEVTLNFYLEKKGR